MENSMVTNLEQLFGDKLLLTVSDICQALGCSEAVVYN